MSTYLPNVVAMQHQKNIDRLAHSTSPTAITTILHKNTSKEIPVFKLQSHCQHRFTGRSSTFSERYLHPAARNKFYEMLNSKK